MILWSAVNIWMKHRYLSCLVFTFTSLALVSHWLRMGTNSSASPTEVVAEYGRRLQADAEALPTKNLVNYETVRNYEKISRPHTHGPGEKGQAVLFNSTVNRHLVRQGQRKTGFNQYVSDLISSERSLPDTRDPMCLEQRYAYNELPKTSVIMCFHEEAWSTLLRSIKSVINRSPPSLLTELILVDDFSQSHHLQYKFELRLKRIPKVRLIRLKSRQGLVRARLAGAAVSKGPVLTFLDSHVECNVGWLEPLLERIRLDKRTIVSPFIDSIHYRTFAYHSGQILRGGFTWTMRFIWEKLPHNEMQTHNLDRAAPLRTPTIAGGIFALDRDFFYRLGSYDPELGIWGMENLELSFKTWMCGGKMELAPCSRVGHVFRVTSPYSYYSDANSIIKRNMLRVVNVWFDDVHKKIFYMLHPELRYVQYGNISERLNIKKRLQCHNFTWYLSNIYPEKSLPDVRPQAAGEVRNEGENWLCLDASAISSEPSLLDIGLHRCHGQRGNQEFRLERSGMLMWSLRCVKFHHPYKYNGSNIRLSSNCHSTEVMNFTYTKVRVKGRHLRELKAGTCLEARNQSILMNPCQTSNIYQHWRFSENYSRSTK